MAIDDVVVCVKESLRSEVLRIFPVFQLHVSAVGVRYDLNQSQWYVEMQLMLWVI